MLENIFIKNYKAYKKENVQLDKNTLLIGTHSSGKTTVLEALDLFFNDVFRNSSIRNKNEDVIIEIHINQTRYRKVYKPPHYNLDFSRCIGNMLNINDISYIYIPKNFDLTKLLNDILSANLNEEIPKNLLRKVFKTSDYIDGVLGNSNYQVFSVNKTYKMSIQQPPEVSPDNLAIMLSNITHHHTILGIDDCEETFQFNQLEKINKYLYQTIMTTDDESIIKNSDTFISTLFKGEKEDDFETIKKRVDTDKTYVLVEGKYDVNWFEKAIRLLELEEDYAVIPCGGSGNMTYVKTQLEKEGYNTITVKDGDTNSMAGLNREVIEQYADVEFINSYFDVNLKNIPKDKHQFFKQIHEKEDVIKNVLSKWAKKEMKKENEFVQEFNSIIQKNNRKK
ncbi:MAG: ATP-binding protein [Candidatus Izimaplasma sp.]|nr:ATP-binding protein [Candidatus Izimaplasma bacterium]